MGTQALKATRDLAIPTILRSLSLTAPVEALAWEESIRSGSVLLLKRHKIPTLNYLQRWSGIQTLALAFGTEDCSVYQLNLGVSSL